MSKFWKVTGYVFLSVLAIIYLSFLLIIPNVVKVDSYKADIQKAVKDSTNLDLDFGKAKVITTPLLEAGVKFQDVSVKLPDGSTLLTSEMVKGKIFLPSLLMRSVRVSGAEIKSPRVSIDIEDGRRFKAAKAYEDLVNANRAAKRADKFSFKNQEEEPQFDISSIKIFVPALKISDYNVKVDDVQANHSLTLKGDELKLAYLNGKVVKLKTSSELLSDDDVNVTANLDIDTFIPKFTPKKEEEDLDVVYALPFVNPVKAYRDYNLKSDVNTKIKIRNDKKTNKIKANGYVNVDNTTVTLSGIELPKSYMNVNMKGYLAEFDTNLYVTNTEYLKLLGKVNYGDKPYMDISLKSPKVYFKNILTITKAYLDTVHIKNDIDQMSAKGYLISNFNVKSDFEDMVSSGNFVIRDGNIYDKNIGLLLDKIKVTLFFDDNKLAIRDTNLLINNKSLDIKGQIDEKSQANVRINSERIPLQALYLAFAPKEIKSNYNLSSGDLALNALLVGEIKDLSLMGKVELHDLIFSDKKSNFILKNKLARFGVLNSNEVLRAKFKNVGLNLSIPATKSVIKDDLIVADFDEKDILINDSDIRLNNNSIITFKGNVENYLKNPEAKIVANGQLVDSDLKILVGESLAPYFDSKGGIPIKFNFESKGKDMKAVTQLQSSANSYITPVKFDKLAGQNLLVQFLVEKDNDSIKMYKSGLYLRKANAPFRDQLSANLLNAKELIVVRAMVSHLNTTPFVNLFKVIVKEDLNGSICLFPKSRFTLSGGSYVYGNFDDLKITGKYNVKNIRIPELMTTIKDIALNIDSRNVRVDVRDVMANGSDFDVKMITNWDLLQDSQIQNVRVTSRNINLDKLLNVVESLNKYLPKAPANSVASAPANIPVEVLDGNINFKRITTGNMWVKDTTADIALLKNVLYVNKLRTLPIDGLVNGRVSMDLITTEMKAKLVGTHFDIAKVLLASMAMKDTLAGDMNFVADVSLKGLTMEEQMSSLKGFVDFNVKDGQLGPFGKFENFLMAENIRENAFFSSTIGSIISDIVTVDTSRFENLYGHMTFENGFANILPIKSQGDVMSMYIFGKVGLVDNSADLKVRGKLASAFSDHLGPLANINPVNLIKNTPGLNVVAAKSFLIFCETISEEEMKALPELGDGKSSDLATKFQIVLRGDTRKPLKMIKSFKWLALDSDIESAQQFVDTIPLPEPGQEGMSVDQLLQIRNQTNVQNQPEEKQSFLDKIKNFFTRDDDNK